MNGMNDNKEELFSRRVRAGSRTYYFDVKKTGKDDNYLVISESKRMNDDTTKRNRIWVFEEDLEKFNAALRDVLEYLEADPNSPVTMKDPETTSY
jgi:glycogen synthase